MPTLVTRGALSAKGFGFGAAAGESYWASITYSGTTYAPRAVSIGPSNVIQTGGYYSGSVYTYLKQANNKTGAVNSSSYCTLSGNTQGISTINSAGNQAIIVDGNYLRIAYANSSSTIQWTYAVYYSGTTWTSGYVLPVGTSVYFSGTGDVTGSFIGKATSSGVSWMMASPYAGTYTGPLRFAIDSSENTYLSLANNQFQKVNSSGTLVWNTRYSGMLFMGKASLDSAQTSVYAAGFSPATGTDFLLLKIDASAGGAPTWARKLTLPANTYVNYGAITGFTDSATDALDNVYFAGTAYDGSGRFHAYIFKYNASGTLQWQRDLYFSTADISNCFIAIDGTGNLIVAAYYYSSGSKELLMKLPSDGSKTGSYSIGGLTLNYSAASCTSASASFITNGGDVTLSAYGGSAFSSGGSTLALSVTTSAITL